MLTCICNYYRDGELYLMDDIIKKWDEIREFAKDEFDISDVNFDIWLRPMEIYGIKDNILYILVPSELKPTIKYIDSNYNALLKTAVAEKTGTIYSIKFTVKEEVEKIVNVKKNQNSSQKSNSYKSNLNPEYTFDKFIVGSNNRFAHTTSFAVAENPGETDFNPLYIYGGPGLGKTHLMQAIGNYIREKNPSSKVIYVTSEEFLNDVIESIGIGNRQASSMSKVRDKYRTADILMIDDIQFLIGKESTQLEFFNTFNSLTMQGKQVVLTSDRPPKELTTLDERMRSRFGSGILADIGAPDYETRMAILRKKNENSDFLIDDEILNYIATNIKSNVRELEGAYKTLYAHHKLVVGEKITMEIAKKELQNIITPDKPREVTIQLIVEVVSEHFGISLDQMMSRGRSKNISKPRQIAMYLCQNMTSEPLENIGNLLGGRDHSTIIHGIRKVEQDLSTDDELQKTIDTIKKKINPN